MRMSLISSYFLGFLDLQGIGYLVKYFLLHCSSSYSSLVTNGNKNTITYPVKSIGNEYIHPIIVRIIPQYIKNVAI